MKRWVFLDVGNILLDEDPIAYHCTRLHWEALRNAGSRWSLADLIEARAAKAWNGSRWPLYDVVSSVLDETACAEVWSLADREIRADYSSYSPLIEGARDLIHRLAPRFRLGLIANQGLECRAWLVELGLLDRFEVVVFSEEVQLYKPDRALYRHALETAGAAVDQTVMIGDRLDNDVAPAATLGMATIWVRWPDRATKGWHPDDPDAIAFRASLETASARSLALYRGPAPSLTVDRLADINPEDVAGLIAARA